MTGHEENEIDASSAPHSGIRRCYPVTANAPVAWQYRENLGSDWGDWFCLNIPIEKFKEDEKDAFEDGLYEIRPLYAAPQHGGVAQAVQEPDAWQCRFNVSGWLPWHDLDTPIDRFCEKYKFNLDNGTCEMRPLYAHPAAQPSPAADAQRAIDFCQWLQGYFKGDLGRDELSAFEANQIRNELNERVFPGLAVSSTDREGK